MSPTLKRGLIGGALLALVLLLALPKLPIWSDGGGGAGGDQESRTGGLEVDLFVVSEERIQDRTITTGSLLANEEVEVRSEISGRLVEIGFTEGDAVRRGDLLVKLNDADLQARKRQLTSRQALARQRASRQEQLLREGGVSQEDYEETLNEIDVLQGDLDGIEAEIAKTEIRAPFNGMVGLRNVSLGGVISPETLVTVLREIDPLRLQFGLPVRYARRIQSGTTVHFTVEALDQEFTGEVYAVDPGLQEGTRTLTVRARTPNPDRILLPGGFADVEVIFEEIEGALTIPTIALRSDAEGQRVFVYRDGRAVSRPVEIGIRTRDRVQVTEGLEPGDSVITTGFQALRDGMEVDPIEVIDGQASERVGPRSSDDGADPALPDAASAGGASEAL